MLFFCLIILLTDKKKAWQIEQAPVGLQPFKNS